MSESTLSTHVLDAVAGAPAAGLDIELQDSTGTRLAAGTTDSDGRIGSVAHDLADGNYRMTFATGAWFAEHGVQAFYPEITISFTVSGTARHYHVPLLLSPYAYSTYRGS